MMRPSKSGAGWRSMCAVAALAVCSLGGMVRADTLVGVVREALETNPELGALRYNRQAIDQELRAARGLNLPTYDVKTDAGRNWNSTKSGTGIEDTNSIHTRREVSTVLSQRVFDGFESRHEVARQKNRVESARWRVADTANSIALRAVQAYLELQRAIAVRGSAQSNLASLEALQARVLVRVSAGRGNAGEESEARARVANGRAVLAEAEARILDAYALFRSVVGRAPNQLAAAQPPRNALPSGVEAAVGQARQFAPSVIATQHDAVAAEAAVGSAYSRLFPRLNLEMTTEHGKSITEAHDRNIDATAMLVVRWNLFNGGIDKARIREASARAAEAAQVSLNTERLIEREVRLSWTAIQSADQRVRHLGEQLRQNRKTRSIYSEQFNAGQRRLLDLLDIQNESFVTEASLRTEELVGKYNTYRVLAAMGKLVPALGLDLPEEAVTPHAPGVFEREGAGRWHTETRAVSEK